MSRHNLSDPGGYSEFLAVMAKGFAPVEDWLQRHWGAAPREARFRRRIPLIETDLAGLAAQFPAVAASVPTSAPKDIEISDDGPAGMLGALYVVEGSRLGAKVLSKRVGAGLPKHFLDDNEPLLEWRALLQQIQQLPEKELDRAAGAASDVFDHFLAVA